MVHCIRQLYIDIDIDNIDTWVKKYDPISEANLELKTQAF